MSNNSISEAARADSAISASEVPVISIGLPIFNAGRYLRKAVLSILQQTFGRWELIIIDDASTDGALDSIQDLHDPRIRIVRGTDNRGLAARLNEAVGLARGHYFARMDQDDISNPERLTRQLAFLESQPEVDVVGARCLLIDAEDRVSGILEFPQQHDEVCRRPWRGILMPHPTWMGKTEWFRTHPYRSPGPYFCEDQELLLRTHRTACFAVLPEALLAYRVRGLVPAAKLLRTRATLGSLQIRHFLSYDEPGSALKAAGLFLGKCVHDCTASLFGLPARSAYAGVPLLTMGDSEQARWQHLLPESPTEGSDSARSSNKITTVMASQTKAESNDERQSSSENIFRPQTFWVMAFFFSCLLALMVQKLLLPLIPSLHGGYGLLVNDAAVFHEAASEIAQKIRSVGWSEWSLHPPNFSGNVGVLSALYALFGPEPAVFIPINVAAHVTGALMLYLIGPLLWPGRIGRLGGLVAATLFVLFPSPLQWYSQNHKDAFTIAASLAMLYGWLLLVSGVKRKRQQVWLALSLALGGVTLVLIIRPHLSLMLGAAFIFSALVCRVVSLFGRARLSSSAGNAWPKGGFLAIVCFGAFVGSLLPASETATGKDFNQFRARILDDADSQNAALLDSVHAWRWKPLMEAKVTHARRDTESESTSTYKGTVDPAGGMFGNAKPAMFLRAVEAPFKRISELRVHFIAHGISVGAGSGIEQDQIPNNALTSILYFPRALMVGLFAPFPSSWIERVSLIRLAGATETFVWYIFFAGVLLLAFKRPSTVFAAGIAFCAVMVAILSYANPNVGTLHRARFGYWMFVLLCGSVGWLGVLFPFLQRVTGGSIHRNVAKNRAMHSDVSPMAGGLDSLSASGAVALLITFIGFIGFLGRDLLLINLRGMDAALDVFFSAAILPMVFVTCLSMPLGDVLTKPFLVALAGNEKSRASDLVRTFLTVGLMIVLPFAALLLCFPGALLRLLLDAVDERAVDAGKILLLIMAPIVLVSVFNIVGNAVLNAWKRSAQAAAAQLVVPVCAIGAILIAPPEQALVAAAVGMLCGAALNAVCVAWLCVRNGVFLLPKLSLAALGKVEFGSYFWLALAASFTALAVPMNFYFAGMVGSGFVSAWAFSAKIITLFNSLFAFGVTAVVLPHLAVKFTAEDGGSGRDHYFFLLIAGTWIGGFVTLALAIFAQPLVFGIFSAGGQLSEDQMATLSTVLRIGALQVPVAISGAIVFKSVVVSGTSMRAVIASLFGLVINVTINQLFVATLGLKAIAIGALLAAMVTTLVAYTGSRARYGASNWVAVILLFGWLVWAGIAWAIDTQSAWAISCGVGGLVVLMILHLSFWHFGLHHRSEQRKTVFLSE